MDKIDCVHNRYKNIIKISFAVEPVQRDDNKQ